MMMMVSDRIFNRPLLIAPTRLAAIMLGLGERFGVTNAEEAFGGLADAAAAAPGRNIETPAPKGSMIGVIPILNTLVHRHGRVNANSGYLHSYQSIGAQLDMMMSDPQVGGILLDVDSGGGEADGVFELANKIRRANTEKPIYAAVNSHAYSAAYALASAAERVFVPPSGGVGSIGVVAMHVDQSKRNADEGLHVTLIHAGKHKIDASPHAPLNEAGFRAIEGHVNLIHRQFLGHVRDMRQEVQLEAVKEATLHYGSDAVAVGLADEVGTFDDAASALAERMAAPAAADAAASVEETLNEGDVEMTQEEVQALINDAVGAAVSQMAAQLQQGQARVAELRQLCQRHGVPELAESLVAEGLGPEAAASRILDVLAERGDRIEVSGSGPAGGEDTPGWNRLLVERYGSECLTTRPDVLGLQRLQAGIL